MKNWAITAALVVLVVFCAGWYLQRVWEQPFPAEVASISPLKAASAPIEPLSASGISEKEAAPSFAPIPPADISDSAVIAAANDLAPQLVQWLAPSEQVRKWVALVDQMAAGKLPRSYLPLDYPMTSFLTKQRHNRLMLNKANYRRADWLINVVTNISTVSLAHTYQTWLPQLNTAFRDIGGKGGFDKRLREAIHQVLVVQPLKSPADLTRIGDYYQFTDPKLEHASAFEKFLWRLGPDNTERLQSYLHELEPLLMAETINSKSPDGHSPMKAK